MMDLYLYYSMTRWSNGIIVATNDLRLFRMPKVAILQCHDASITTAVHSNTRPSPVSRTKQNLYFRK